MNDSNGFYKSLLDGIGDGVYFVDRDREILYWNPMAEQITGYTAAEMIGRHCYDNILQHVDETGRHLCFDGCPLSKAIEDDEPKEATVYLRHKEGHRVPVRVKVRPTRDPDGVVTGAVEIFTDHSALLETKLKTMELERQVMLDPLTQLPNRRHLDTQLAVELESLQQRGCCLGIMVFDIDNFKAVNDTYGHQVGDEMLKIVANTLMANMRPQDFVGRWGGEEFLLLVPDIDEKGLFGIADRLRALIRSSTYSHEGESISVTVSIGTAMADDTATVEEVIAAADRAMYNSKRTGKNRVTQSTRMPAVVPKPPESKG